MANEMNALLRATRSALDRQDDELAAGIERQFRRVRTRLATGTGDIAQEFKLERRFRLIFVRCHFSGGTGSADLTIRVRHASGSAYDTVIKTLPAVGTGADAVFPSDALLDPSPWTFQTGDAVRIEWTNPDPGNMTWGLELGLALSA